MTVRFYSGQDTGAPALINSGGTTFANLRLLLQACLVNGYGTKPAAGWSVGHDVTDGFSLANSGGDILCISAVTSSTVEFTLMETITDGSTAIPSGYNRRSGKWYDGQAELTRHRLYNAGFSTATDKRWYVVADDRTAIVYIAGGSSAVNAGYQFSTSFYFGEYTSALGLPGFCCLGGYVSNGTSGTSTLMATNAGTVLRQPFTGAVDQGIAPVLWAGGAAYGASSQSYSRSVLMPVDLRPMRAAVLGAGAGISGSTNVALYVYCGRLRGVITEPALSIAFLSEVLQALGVSSPTYMDALNPLTMENGSTWVPMFPSTGDLGGFISLDASEWD